MATKKETPSEKEKKDEAPDVESIEPKKDTKKAAPKKTTSNKKASSAKKSKKASKSDAGLSIGIDVKLPEGTCTDKSCPFHGTLPVRGQILEGVVVSDKMQATAVVKRDYMRKNQKYERLEKRSNKYVVHNPSCLGVVTGDNVKIMECRPLSKMVSFVIIEKM